ncbi:MAG TPA: methyl-accepting chemotaxis protein [Spirochaetota bacterium]|mgnify:CR=1 FL=1|nr:methyl-accepting chemotaxis protein [Spirochaetota bacterium]HPS85556.1 methyl-accepting chemotaxis protein [Spirochaetota bacterium]
MSVKLTARQYLEKKGAFYYLLAFAAVFFLAVLFQSLAGVRFKAILLVCFINSINLILAFIIYYKKSRGLKANLIPWILGFTSVSGPIIIKFSYAFKEGWTFAVQSTNSTSLMVLYVIMLYLFYQPNLFKFFSFASIASWICILYLAYINGAEFYWDSSINGVPVTSGVIILREVFVLISMALIMVITYRNIPDIIKYEERSLEQTDRIKKHADTQMSMTAIIKEKMNVLFQKVNNQHELINRFNLKMETQASSFSEMSATMEELAGSAEQIASESIIQIEGNVKMESIVDEFRNIQVETKQNLAETYADIQSVSDKSTVANDQLMEVEKTVFAIKEQSGRIGDTVNLIVDIADKINLLSLNASIEAARAGEAGRGFAVVADEIGKLAFQTQESIKEINKVLSDSSKNTVDGVSVIQKTAEMMREMIAHMGQSAHKIQLLQESIFIEEKYIKIIIGQMNDNIMLAKKIGTATDEQKVAVESTSQALEDLIVILNEMVNEIKDMARTAHEIHENAVDVMVDTEKAVSGMNEV